MSRHHNDHHDHRTQKGRRNTLTLPPIRSLFGDVLAPQGSSDTPSSSHGGSRRSSWHGRHGSISPDPYTIPHRDRHSLGHHTSSSSPDDRQLYGHGPSGSTSPASSYDSRPSLDTHLATKTHQSLRLVPPGPSSPYAGPPSSASPHSPSPSLRPLSTAASPHLSPRAPLQHLSPASRAHHPPSAYTHNTARKLLPSQPIPIPPASPRAGYTLPPPATYAVPHPHPHRPTLQLSPPHRSYAHPPSSYSPHSQASTPHATSAAAAAASYSPHAATTTSSPYLSAASTSSYGYPTPSPYHAHAAGPSSAAPPSSALGLSSGGASASASATASPRTSFPFPPSSRETSPEGPPPIRIKLRRRKRGGGFKVGGNAYATLLDLDTDENDYVNGPFRTVKIEVSGTKEGKLVYELDIPEAMIKHDAKMPNSPYDPHPCILCGSIFVSERHMNRHMLTHTDIKPYTCDKCNKPFARPDSMVRHRRNVHGISEGEDMDVAGAGSVRGGGPASLKGKAVGEEEGDEGEEVDELEGDD